MPNGTCYLTDSAEAAVRERASRYSAARTWVPANAVDGVLVSSVATLQTATGYGLTSRWAVALFGAEGSRTWAVRSSRAMREFVISMGLKIAPVPHSVDTDDTTQANGR